MTTDLREELSALAETQTFSPDPSAWDRGRRVRRRARIGRGAAVVAIVAAVAGLGSLAVRPDAVGPAGGVEQEVAIPSVITEPDGPAVSYKEVTRASVAWVDPTTRMPVLVDATTGIASLVELPGFPEPELVALLGDRPNGPLLAVSPDGTRVAYAATVAVDAPDGRPTFSTSFYRVLDLGTGETTLLDVPPRTGTPRAIWWSADGELAVDVYGLATARGEAPPIEAWTIDPETGDSSTSSFTGVTAPGGGISAPYPLDDEPVAVVSFESSTGSDPSRSLPPDLYPDGAVVDPVGWADNSLLVATVGDDLVLLTSPDRPESEWIWRVLVSDVPESSGISIAVDLVPDLSGDPDQELTRDFSAISDAGPRWISLTYALAGVLAVLVGLVLIGSMGRRT